MFPEPQSNADELIAAARAARAEARKVHEQSYQVLRLCREALAQTLRNLEENRQNIPPGIPYIPPGVPQRWAHQTFSDR